MTNWWELSPGQIDALSSNERLLAYYNTFYASENGRQVLLDIQRMCFEKQENAEASLALIALYGMIRAKCGVDLSVEKASLDGEAKLILVTPRRLQEEET